MDKNLYVILPYYNYFNNSYRVSNILKFIETYKGIDNCKIVVVEGIANDSEHLKDLSDQIFKHIKYKLPQKIWVKENLINLVLQNHLPQDYNFFCWLDSDIFFENKDWVDHTINLLKENDAIQMFDFCINQGEKKEYKNKVIGQIAYELKSYDSTGFSYHCGFGWGMNKNFYNKIGKLWEYNIIGGGDSIIGRSISQKLTEKDILTNDGLSIIYSKTYGEQVLQYYKKFKNCKYSFLPTTIHHFFHGDMYNRLYTLRHNFIKDLSYDASMVNYNSDGIIYTTEEVSKQIFRYMKFRESVIHKSSPSKLLNETKTYPVWPPKYRKI